MLTRRWLVPLVTMLALLLSGCQLAQGGSWESLGPEQGGIVLSITTDPFHSHLIYVGTSTGVVYVASADTGPNLVPGNGIPHNALVTSLLADPVHEGTIYAGTSAGLYVSKDQSVTWRPRGTGFPSGETIVALAYATKGNVFFAGTVTHGVFSSHDQGNTWQAASVGLPASSDMNALLYDPSTGTVYAAVDSVGIFASSNLGAILDGGLQRSAEGSARSHLPLSRRHQQQWTNLLCRHRPGRLCQYRCRSYMEYFQCRHAAAGLLSGDLPDVPRLDLRRQRNRCGALSGWWTYVVHRCARACR